MSRRGTPVGLGPAWLKLGPGAASLDYVLAVLLLGPEVTFFMREAQPGHHLPHHRMTDAHTMRAFQPRPQFAQFRVGPRFDLLAHGAHQRLKPKRHMVVLRPGRGVAMLAQPGADLGDV